MGAYFFSFSVPSASSDTLAQQERIDALTAAARSFFENVHVALFQHAAENVAELLIIVRPKPLDCPAWLRHPFAELPQSQGYITEGSAPHHRKSK
jgi:hypothetical protein